MGRAPCCDKASVKKGPWSPEEDLKLKEYIEKYGTGGNWIALPQKAGLRRCGKSCRLRWLNYLRPNIKHGEFSDDEDRIICTLFANIGSRWSIIAAQLPGRTDNDIKNYWNTKLKKKLMSMVVQLPPSSQRKPHQAATFSSLHHNFSSATISSALSTSSSSAYKCNNNNSNYYYSQARSFTNLDQTTAISMPSVFQSHPQESVLGPMQNYYQVKDTILTFGGDQSSCCTSSDGSSSNGGSNGEQMALQSYFYINGDEENQKFMLSNNGTTDGVNGWSEEKPKGLLWGDSDQTPIMDYGFEEIKQLISTNICNFFVDESKTEERAMYY